VALNKDDYIGLKDITVLYVEDEDALRMVTTNILKGFTKTQYIAEDGLKGLELFKEHQDKIDLIISDINMPEMTGLEMSAEIKKINPRMPIIITTAFSNTEYLLEAINMGIDKYVMKPVDIKNLLDTMVNSLTYHELKNLYTDNLTGLPNRNMLLKDLKATPSDLMAFLNIDKFSTLNDLYGEDIGDSILKEFALEINRHFPSENYMLYRIEADKFGVISKDSNMDINVFYNNFERFGQTIERSGLIVNDGDEVIDLNISIGIAKANDNHAYEYAQRVMGYARRNFIKIAIHDSSLHLKEDFEENLYWVKKLKKGFENGNLKAFLQPIVHTSTGEVYKYESLIRYVEDDGTVISPFKFLNIAKKAKLFPMIIKTMLSDVLKIIEKKRVKIAVNVSFEDIAHTETREFISMQLMMHTELAPYIHFELLESAEIEDFEMVVNFIKEVRSYGCGMGIDDFGAGYSNFDMLVNLGVDFVKIDGSLIKDIANDKNQQLIVETIVGFTKKLNLKTVAEFVCDEDVYNKVKEIGVDYCQGYYFSPPVPVSEI